MTAISAELHFGHGLQLQQKRCVGPGLPTLLGAVPKRSEPSDPKGEKVVEKAQCSGG